MSTTSTSTGDPTPDPGPSNSRARTIASVGLIAAAVIVALTIVFLRGADGPLVVQNTGGERAAVALGDRVAATIEVKLPEGKDARITAVRTSVGGGLRIVEDYVAAPEGGPAPRTAYVWKGAVESGDADPKQPGAFRMSKGPAVGAVITAVARTTKPGLAEFKAVEIDYSMGSKRHRKRVSVDFDVCVNPKGTSRPVATACKAPVKD